MKIEKKDIIYKFGISYEIEYNDRYFCSTKGAQLVLYRVDTGEQAAILRGVRYPNYVCFLNNNRLLAKNTLGFYYIFDLETEEIAWRSKSLKSTQAQDSRFALSSDQKYLLDFVLYADEEKDILYNKLMLLDIESGERSWVDMDGYKETFLAYDEHERQFYVMRNKQADGTDERIPWLHSLPYPDNDGVPPVLKPLGEIGGRAGFYSDYSGGKFVYDDFRDGIYICDVHELTSRRLCDAPGTRCLRWSESGKYVVCIIPAKTPAGISFMDAMKPENRRPDEVAIIDAVSGKTVVSYEVQYGFSAKFYDHDTKLLIGTANKGYLIDISSVL